jgi:hypothetical protein
MARGAMSMQAARTLQPEFSQQGFDILHAHGQPGVDSPLLLGRICSWFGDAYQPGTILAHLDMAVVSHEAFISHTRERAYALVVIEESSCKPRAILGDIVATLLGMGIKFQDQRDLQVGKWTSLIVLAHDVRQAGFERIPFLAGQSKYLRENLLTPNASLGRVVIDMFVDEGGLEEKLRQNITAALLARGAW